MEDPTQLTQDAAHGAHEVPTPGSLSKKPAAHDVHEAASGPVQVPHAAAQGAQVVTSPLGSLSKYPAAHEVHANAEPAQALQLAPHGVHTTLGPGALS